jgi:hypothetical protein
LNNPPKTRGRPRKIKSIPQVSITTITLFWKREQNTLLKKRKNN